MYFRASIGSRIVIDPDLFILRLENCRLLAEARSGQFIMMRGDWDISPLLSRAYSVFRVHEKGVVDILICGTGRAATFFASAPLSTPVYIMGPRGTSFPEPNRQDLLIVDTLGIAPLMLYIENAVAAGIRPTLHYLNPNDRLVRYLYQLDIDIRLVNDISYRGIEYLRTRPRVLAAGTNATLRSAADLARRYNLSAYFRVNTEMACGVGACLVCAIPCAHSIKYACMDGPVYTMDELGADYYTIAH